MASLLLLTSIIQPLLLMLNNGIDSPTLAQNFTLSNPTQNATADVTPLKTPTDLSSLIAFVYSFSALRDYLKLIILGGAFETLRRLSSASYASLVDRFFITATFESDDMSFGECSSLLATLHAIDRGDQNG
jgi:chaperone BCS1